ncbi:MAG TPA: MarR family transcriptional regulator [Acidimicrobiales bacterium]|nr:MarR family transcriptional regulator [Acidimicrobiales bacterium]
MSAFATCLQLVRATAEVRRRFDAGLSIHGLSLSDYTILRILADAPAGQLRRVDVAERLGMTPSGATRLLAPLEARGLAVRLQHPSDARASLSALTDEGRHLVEDATTTAEEVADRFVEARLASAEIVSLSELLVRLVPPSY